MRILIYRTLNAGIKFPWAKIGFVKKPFSIRAKVPGRLAINCVPDRFAWLRLEVGTEALLRIADPYAARLGLVNPPHLWREALGDA
jgi:hypothetical protein